MSVVLALGALLLCMSACQHIPKTQLVMFESISFNMPIESFEKAFGEADEVIEETETAYRDTWYASILISIKQAGFSIITKILH